MHRGGPAIAVVVFAVTCGVSGVSGAAPSTPAAMPAADTMPGADTMPAADTMVASAAERLERLAERCGLADAAFRSRVGRARSVDALVAAAEGLVTLRVHVNPESRVKLHAVGRVGDLVVGRPRTLLVEIVNEAGVTAPLSVRCLDLADGPGRPATF